MVQKVVVGPVVFVTASRGATVEEALKLTGGHRILSNAELDKLLMGARPKWQTIREAMPCWTGTMVAHGEPGAALGKAVEYKHGGLTWVFPVPERFQGEKDAAISVNHPDFTIRAEGEKRIIVVGNTWHVTITKNFPPKNGWYKTGLNGVPAGKEIDSHSPDARHMYRAAGPLVSLVSRASFVDGRRYVYIGNGPSVRLGVAVEGKPAGDASAPENITKKIGERKQD